MLNLKFKFNGTYGAKIIKAELFLSKKSPYLLIFFHGCCSGPYDIEPTLYEELSPFLAEKNVASVAFFQSSRKFEKRDLKPEQLKDYNNYLQLCFGGKTFEKELKDAQIAVEGLVNEYVKVNANKPILVFVGFSLGGVIASILSAKYSVKHLIALGSADEFAIDSSTPILGGVALGPKLRTLTQYRGSVLMIRGSEDATSEYKNAMVFFERFKNAVKKEYIELKGVDHRFRMRLGKEDRHVRWEIADLLMAYLKRNA